MALSAGRPSFSEGSLRTRAGFMSGYTVFWRDYEPHPGPAIHAARGGPARHRVVPGGGLGGALGGRTDAMRIGRRGHAALSRAALALGSIAGRLAGRAGGSASAGSSSCGLAVSNGGGPALRAP